MGEFAHNLDAKGRLIVPAKFRNELGTSMVVNRGLDGCLALYTKDAWDKIYDSLKLLPTTKKEVRAYVRLLTAKASDVVPDSQGRILIPASLLEENGFEKECMIVGAGDKVEIWPKDRWLAYYEEESAKLEDLAESISGLMI